ncbi:peptide deformylase [Enterococcus lemanii]|jgi:peptide deformylase|uniref:Peptide deformylase n=1 Tax=Enterococcus lemanii TaxID=1159752 RepID=A0ABV9MRG2_9ENTE|nr:peptide deformylase [Enterococcus lemanii]MBM7708481.1 peptide deformylase [Enterococcus lemanii]NLM68247.1 peptide deformylase [Enterococcus sp.]
MRYPIVIHPNKKLYEPSTPVEAITPALLKLLDDLHETMLAHDGVGIAAPQVGKNIQVALVEVEEGDLFELINPQVLSAKGREIDVEGCLSIPHVFGTVARPDEIIVRYYDREGEEMEVEAYGYLARAILHEIDHLQGKLFIDQMIEQIPEEELENYMEEKEND